MYANLKHPTTCLIVRLLSFSIISWTELTFLQYIHQTGDQNGARLQSTGDHAVKQLSICRLLLVKKHRFLILPSYPNESSALSVVSYADSHLSHVFHLTTFLCVMLSRRQMRCLATKLGHRLTYFCIGIHKVHGPWAYSPRKK